MGDVGSYKHKRRRMPHLFIKYKERPRTHKRLFYSADNPTKIPAFGVQAAHLHFLFKQNKRQNLSLWRFLSFLWNATNNHRKINKLCKKPKI